MRSLLPTRPRIAVAAAPRLLADGLRALLADFGNDVVLVDSGTDERFDVVLGTPDAVAVPAGVTIVLDCRPGEAVTGRLWAAGESLGLQLDGLPAIVDFVRGCCRQNADGISDER